MSDNEVYRIEKRGDRTRLVTRDWTATLIYRLYETRTQYWALSRVYGAVDTFAPSESKAYDDAVTADPDTNHVALRRVAISKARVGLLEALDTLAEHVEFDVNFRDLDGSEYPRAGTFKVKFSAKAGCSCECSPGFIVSDDILRLQKAHVDIWFDTRYEDSLTAQERKEVARVKRDTMKITPKDRAQAVFYALTELDAIKTELGVG